MATRKSLYSSIPTTKIIQRILYLSDFENKYNTTPHLLNLFCKRMGFKRGLFWCEARLCYIITLDQSDEQYLNAFLIGTNPELIYRKLDK